MKYLLLLSIVLLLSCNNAKKPLHCTEYINCEPVKSQLTFGLKGKVKEIVDIKLYRPWGADTYDTSSITFNEQGFVTSYRDSTYSYEYNDKGLLVTVYVDYFMDKLSYKENGELYKYQRFPKGIRAPEVARTFSYKDKRVSKSEMKDYRHGHDYVAYHTYNNNGSSMVVRMGYEDKYNDTLLYNKEGLLTKSTIFFISALAPNSIMNNPDASEPKPDITKYVYLDFDENGNWTSCKEQGYIGESSRSWENKYTRQIIYY